MKRTMQKAVWAAVAAALVPASAAALLMFLLGAPFDPALYPSLVETIGGSEGVGSRSLVRGR